jgi:beta-lactamase class A
MNQSENNKKNKIQRIRLLLGTMLLLAFACMASWISPEHVSAASQVKVAFTDKSGSYLKSSGSDWYLYDKEGKSLTGVQYLAIPEVDVLNHGWYMFDGKGKLLQKKAVYYFTKQTVHGAVFNGYYYANKYGRFATTGQGFYYLSGLKCKDYNFTGYFFIGPYGKLNNKAQVRYLKEQTVNKRKFQAGFYYFNSYGALCGSKAFRTVSTQTVNGVTFSGTYYFGDTNGRLYTKAGWVTVGGQTYYVTADGKRAENCTQEGYNLQADGTRRVNFTNKSGSYLVPISSDWYLYDKNGAKLTGIQYIKISSVGQLATGWYMFDSSGKLVQKKAVYYFKKQTVNNVVFKGYYYANQNGRFVTNGYGLYYLSGLSCNNVTFNGYFYVDQHGFLSNKKQVRYLAAKKVNGNSFQAGYYLFNNYGQLYVNKAFRQVSKQTVNGVTFNGTYYFGETNGRLTTTAGWITVKGQKYYVTAKGKRAENCWKSGYYLQSDGTIAKSTRVADGSYVDCDGHKSTASEYKLSGFKKTLSSTLSSYSGTWGVYVKDLSTGDELCINDTSMYAASTIKAFVMASTFDQIKQGKLSYSSTVKNLLYEMITDSSNEAYNQLVKLNSSSRSFVDGAAVVNNYLKKNGYTKTACHHTLHPASSSYSSDGNGKNVISVKDAGTLLEKIYKGTCVSSAYSKDMLNLLLQQVRTWKIPYSLPSGTKVANKTGETDTTQHDMAIVYGPKTTYVICVFSTGVSSYNGITGIRNISRMVYDYLNS